jgi:hypothetical protein
MIFTEIARELQASGVGSKDVFTILNEIAASMDELDFDDLRTSLMRIIVGCIAAIEHLDRSADENRQMFYVLGDTLFVAEKGDERNHALWMLDEGDLEFFDEATRGHVDGTGLYIYEIDDDRFRELVPRIIEHIPVNPECNVFIGVPSMSPQNMGKVKDWCE